MQSKLGLSAAMLFLRHTVKSLATLEGGFILLAGNDGFFTPQHF